VLGGTYDELTALAATSPPGSGGLLFMPWLKGERTPVEDRNLRAGFLNLSMHSDRPALVRSVLEGVAFNARWLLDATESFAGRRLESLRILGGGAVSDLWCQVHADILGRRLERVAGPMSANLRGAGLFAALSLGRLSLDQVPGLVQVDGVFEPDPAAAAVYAPMYREFKQLYGRLHPMYARLNGRG
jgi:xylulokinase